MDKSIKKLILANYLRLRVCRRNISDLRGKNVIFSGIQPTGAPHLGNYLGAIKPWITLQESESNRCIFSIVDLHSLTLVPTREETKRNIKEGLAALLACGLNPEKCIVFQQSSVDHHASLCWILGCLTTMARLERLPQFKEKSASLKDVPLGIYVYPVLQSADILLYKANQVPVGKDQLHHIQIAQNLAVKFNKMYTNTFPVPSSLILGGGLGGSVKNLRDPTKKMSKSEKDGKSRIDIIDEPDVIVNKCRKALTDFNSRVEFDPEARPGVSNLVQIYSLLTGKSTQEVCTESQNLTTADFKLALADIVIDHFKPIRQRFHDLLNNQDYLESVLKKGAVEATRIAEKTSREVKDAIGLS